MVGQLILLSETGVGRVLLILKGTTLKAVYHNLDFDWRTRAFAHPIKLCITVPLLLLTLAAVEFISNATC